MSADQFSGSGAEKVSGFRFWVSRRRFVKRSAGAFQGLVRLLRGTVFFSLLAIVTLCWFSPGVGLSAEQKAPDAPKPAPASPPVEIPLADIAARATEVSNLLSGLTTSTVTSVQIENISKSLPELNEKLDGDFAETTAALAAEPTLETLQTLQQQWQRNQLEPTAWLNTLTQHATKLQHALNQFAELQKTWQ